MLRLAGIPLELLVANECKRFCTEQQVPEGPCLDTRKVVYSPLDEPESYREVDQVIHIYEEFPIGQHTGVQLSGTLAIECKHRHDVEYFAFPVDGDEAHEGFPLWSSLAGSQLFRSLRKTYSQLGPFTSAAVSMIEIRDGKTPSNTYKENLIYNGVASLYDFVLADIRESPLFGTNLDKNDWNKTDTFTKFQLNLEKNNYAWWSVLRDEIAALSVDDCRFFNENVLTQGRVYYGMSFMMPIICVDGPIYQVSCNPMSEIKDFTEIDSCLISIRKQKWPGLARFALLRRTPEVPAILTNTKGLRGALEIAYSWHKDIRDKLSKADPILIERWPLEAALYSRVLDHYELIDPLLNYRSDIDIEDHL